MLKNLVWRVRIAFSEILMSLSRPADRVAELVVVLLAEIDAFLGRGDEDGEGTGGGLGSPVGPRPGRPPVAPTSVAGGLRRVQAVVVVYDFVILVLTAMLIVVTYISPTRSLLRKVLARVLGRRLRTAAALVLPEYRDVCSDDGDEGMGGGGLATPAGPRPGRPPVAPASVAAWLCAHVTVLSSGLLLAPVESLLRKALAQLRAPSIVMHEHGHEHGAQVLAAVKKGTVVALAAHRHRTTSPAQQDQLPVVSSAPGSATEELTSRMTAGPSTARDAA